LSLNIPERGEEKTERGHTARPGTLTGDQLLIEARCARCEKLIEENEERALAAGMMVECHRVADDDPDYTVGLRVGQALHYCSECAYKIEDFRIPNPWFVPENERHAMAEYQEQAQAQAELEAADQSKELSAALATGDTSSFNAAMPTSAPRDDVMGHAVPISQVASQIAEKQDGSTPTAEIAEQVFADDERWEKMAGARASGSGEATQRSNLLDYLNSPTSRGMPHTMRQAARLWADGASQTEISRRLGVDQSVVSRMIKGARNRASGAR
jgi:hypothetical protein